MTINITGLTINNNEIIINYKGGDDPIPKWDGWATVTYDGPGDWVPTQRFCGSSLKGVPHDNNKYNNAGVSIPWVLLCKEFKSKHCLLNHVCQSCYKCKANCGSANPDAKTKADNCPDPDTYKNGINKYGLCWEAQRFKKSITNRNTFNANKVKQNSPPYTSYNGTDAIDIEDDTSIELSDTYTFKFATGCGGNCKNLTNTCSSSFDCVNKCKAPNNLVTSDPCNVTKGTHCEYLSWTNKNKGNITKNNINDVFKNNSCRFNYDVKSGLNKYGNKSAPPDDAYVNWCGGGHMHFDVTNKLSNLTMTGDWKGNILRYRQIQCEPTNQCI